jgi:hypothetical protein
MSSSRRPWFPWCPKEFISDEKVKGLSDDAELLYRRALDCMWEASAVHMLSNSLTIANQIARGWSTERFEKAWSELFRPGWEIFKTSECGNFIYSERLRREACKIENISKIKSQNGKKASAKHQPSISRANAKHQPSHPDPDPYPDIKEIPPTPSLEKPARKNRKSQTLIPENFEITDAMRQWFNEQNFQYISIETKTREFADYWRSKGESKADWEATWRNGMRKHEEWAKKDGRSKVVARPAITPQTYKPFEPTYVD